MKNIKFKILAIMVIIMLAMILPLVNNVQAASFSASAKTTELQPNGTTQLLISTSGCAGSRKKMKHTPTRPHLLIVPLPMSL